MTTFKVDDVTNGEFSYGYMTDDNQSIIKHLVGHGVEASSSSQDSVMVTTHNLISAINTAYDQHLPLVLSPDMIWLSIAQGLSTHITNNSEQLRPQFVNFEGKKELEVQEDSFVKGNPNNNWPHMLGEFSQQIAQYIGKKRNLIINSFSTTGPIELAASEVVLMESMSNYFDYTCLTCCGIPNITLLGSVPDWQDIQTRIRNIAEFDLGWWTQKLEPIMQEFVNTAQGKVNKSFWKNIYKIDNDSGGPYISGWITNFFPYLKDYQTHRFVNRNEFSTSDHFGGLTSSVLPIGLAKVPFKWKYYDQEFKMELVAGFTGFQIINREVTPQIGWFVRDTEIMIEVSGQLASINDYKKKHEIQKIVQNRLKGLGFDGYIGWNGNISGSVPKEQVQAARAIIAQYT